MNVRPSPNFDARPQGRAPDMIVLHYTGMKSGDEALSRLCDPASRVSAHYFIDEDGTLTRLVAETMRAWHAGQAFWQGEEDINGCSIGIELQNPGHEFGYRAFPETQIQSLIALIKSIRTRFAVPDARILGHSDVA
ncbi:MAG TPA: N-acetylmuramoyl-L-alanine amidase, partial [Sphingomonadales bacterium]|nr:N-acetylmuramoyl-L-alanine amidase [Sphingomonadales bacterium]